MGEEEERHWRSDSFGAWQLVKHFFDGSGGTMDEKESLNFLVDSAIHIMKAVVMGIRALTHQEFYDVVAKERVYLVDEEFQMPGRT